MAFLGVIGRALGDVFGVVDKVLVDKDQAAKLKAELQAAALAGELAALEQAALTVRAEATGEGWLQRSWRPLVMLTFTALIVARWLGFTVDGIDAETERSLLDIVQVGLGGYVLGRSGEKMIKEWKK